MGLFNRISGSSASSNTNTSTSETETETEYEHEHAAVGELTGPTDDGYGSVAISKSFANERIAALPQAIRVRPIKEHEGIPTAVDFLEAIHDVREVKKRRQLKNVSTAHAFEIRYSGERINFQFVPGDHSWGATLERQLTDKYPDAQIDRADAGLLSISEGDYVAGATLSLDRYTLFPIRHLDLEGFQRDPFGSITSEMVGTSVDGQADADVVVQIMFRPASRDWTDGVNSRRTVDTIAKELEMPKTKRGGILRQKYTVDPSQKDKRAAKIVREQRGKKGWEINIRVLAASENADIARERVEKAAGMFRNYYESSTEQRFVPEPLSGRELLELVDHAYSRTFVQSDIVKSQEEAAGLIHVPNASINQQNVQWALSRPGHGVPPGTPRFDFDAAGVARASDAEQQAAMFESSSPGKPIWFGRGRRNGIEAGVEEEILRTHAFIGGASGYGKTTFGGKNLFKQIVDRGYGCLMYDPKGMDAEDIASLIPEEREDDLIYIELGSNREHQVGFNFLEIPGSSEPGTPEHAAALESMADDLEAILPLASGVNGAEGSWGTRMSRIARNIARGLGKLDREVTLYDAHVIANSAAGRQAYAGALEEEEVNFIKDYAINHLQEMDDDALEPFAGRLQQLIENDTVREIVTLKDGFSIDDAVAEGKIIIVRDNDPSDTTGKMVATALIRRIWVSIREQTYDPDRPDPDQFYAILDEFKEIATVNSDVAEILSDARSFGLSMIVMTQDLSSQLSDKIMEAVEGQAETFITFNPGREADARIIASQHSKDVDYEDLLELSKYRFYMRTHDENGDKTHSYKVQAFPPVDEIEGMARSPEETEAMIDRRIREVGSKRRTDEEIMAGGGFDIGGVTSPDSDGDDDIELSPYHQSVAIKAVYDEAYRQTEDGNGFAEISLDDAHPRISAYLEKAGADAPTETAAQLGSVLRYISEGDLRRVDRDGDLHVACTEDGRMTFLAGGSTQNDGGEPHRQLLRDAYDRFLDLGVVLTIPDQDGGAMPDGLISLDDIELLETEGVSPREIAQRFAQFEEEYPLLSRLTGGAETIVEAECSTGDKTPSQTIENLAQALNEGVRCLFLARSSTASRVSSTLTDPPLMSQQVDGEMRRLYNSKKRLRIDGERVFRPSDADETVWLYDSSTEMYVLSDSDGERYARFPNGEAIFDPSNADRYPRVGEPPEGAADEWISLPRPIAPDQLFDAVRAPSELSAVAAEWDILVVPAADSEEGLQIYDPDTGEATELEAVVMASDDDDDSGADPELDFDLDDI